MKGFQFVAVGLLALVLLGAGPTESAGEAGRASIHEERLQGLVEATQVELVLSAPPERWMALRRFGGAGRPEAAAIRPEKTRGGTDWPGVYERVAPAVVFLSGARGFGTGFLVDERTVVTNHHVAGLGSGDEARQLVLNAYVGSLGPDGAMLPAEEPITARVLEWDPRRDLALLRLDRAVAGARPLEISSAPEGGPRAGQEVALVGNAGLGLLWSMKPGHVSAIGTLRANLPDLLFMLDSEARGSEYATSLTGDEIDRLRGAMEQSFNGWIGADTLVIQATASVSRGDSGGPLVDAAGRVMGICFGLRHDRAGGTYFYVHRKEIADFLSRRPGEPLLALAYDFWGTAALRHGLAQYSGAAAPALVGADELGRATFIAADLDGDTQSAEAEWLVSRKAYDAEVALVVDFAAETAFGIYDLDNDGIFELQRLDTRGDGFLDEEYVRRGDRYVGRKVTGRERLFLAPAEVPAAWRAAYGAFLAVLRAGPPGAPAPRRPPGDGQ